MSGFKRVKLQRTKNGVKVTVREGSSRVHGVWNRGKFYAPKSGYNRAGLRRGGRYVVFRRRKYYNIS